MRILLFLLFTLVPSFAYALEPYVYGAIGASLMNATEHDGTWLQKAFPYQTNTTDLAYKGGLGFRSDTDWFLEAGYVNLGTARINSYDVSDADYDAVAHTCLHHCGNPSRLAMQDSFRGAEFVVGKGIRVDDVLIYAKVGGAYLWHTISGTVTSDGRMFTFPPLTGGVPSIVAGGGVCYKWVCGDVSYYRGIGETQNPFTKEFIVPTAYLKVPLMWWR